MLTKVCIGFELVSIIVRMDMNRVAMFRIGLIGFSRFLGV